MSTRQRIEYPINGIEFVLLGPPDGWAVYLDGDCLCFGIATRNDAENFASKTAARICGGDGRDEERAERAAGC